MKYSVWTSLTLALLPLALSACGGGGTPAPVLRTEFSQPTRIEGKIQDYPGSSGTVKLLSSNGEEVLSSVSTDGLGNFQVSLPAVGWPSKLSSSVMDAPFKLNTSKATCTGTLVVSDLSVATQSFDQLRLIQGSKDVPLSSATYALEAGVSSTESTRYWVYASGKVSLTSSRTCTASTTKNGVTQTNTLTIRGAAYLKTGWNVVQKDIKLSQSGNTLTLEWTLSSLDAGPSVWQIQTAELAAPL